MKKESQKYIYSTNIQNKATQYQKLNANTKLIGSFLCSWQQATACQLKPLEEQEKSIDYLRRKVELLEGRISELESQIHVTQTVNSLLQTKIDNQEQ